MGRLKEAIKQNKKLHGFLYPFVYKWRYFIHADCRTAAFFIKWFFRKIHVIPCDPHLIRLENRYKGKGKRIFVIATGPSLRISDLDWLDKRGEICIACNDINFGYDKTKWRPDYYLVNDDVYYINYMKEHPEFRFETFSKKLSLVPEYVKPHLSYKYDRKKISFFPVCYFDHWITRPGRVQKYSRNFKYACYDLYTVTNSMLEFADFLGFEEIYLLGCDCNLYGKDSHFMVNDDISDISEDQKNSCLTDTEINYMRGFEIVHEATEKRGVHIYNATRGGSLEVFPRVNMDDIISEKV